MDAQMPSRWVRARSIILIALIAAGALALGTAKPAHSATSSTNGCTKCWYWWTPPRATCISNNNGQQVYAHVYARQEVVNEAAFPGSHYVSRFRLKARLDHPGPGLGSKPWHTTRVFNKQEFEEWKHYDRRIAVNTSTQSIYQDWNVQVKLIWDRKIPYDDKVREFTFSFETGNCKPGGGPCGGAPSCARPNRAVSSVPAQAPEEGLLEAFHAW
jgi:hypothetical protein